MVSSELWVVPRESLSFLCCSRWFPEHCLSLLGGCYGVAECSELLLGHCNVISRVFWEIVF